ncbi:mechanosensitive ion channel [Ectothiorhodospiraceae bacterium 2226]|nr:mechanosensitive ion channel [Ectothiorhodospiraceae bacterium 2226]
MDTAKDRLSTHRPRGATRLWLVLIVLFGLAAGAAAAAPEPAAPSEDATAEQRAAHHQRLQELDPESIDEATIEQADLDVASARVAVEGIEVELTATDILIGNQEGALSSLRERQRALKAAPAEGQRDDPQQERLAAVNQEIADKETALASARLNAQQLRAGLAEAQLRLALAREWAQVLKTKFHSHQELNRQAALDELQERVKAQEAHWAQHAAAHRKALEAVLGDTPETEAERRLLRARITDAGERAKLVQLELLRARAQHRLQALEEGAAAAQDARDIETLIEQAEVTLAELQTQENLVQRKGGVIQQQFEVAARRQALQGQAGDAVHKEKDLLAALVADLAEAQQAFGPLLSAFAAKHADLKAMHDSAVQQGLWVRRALPVGAAEWSQLRERLAEIPSAFAVTSGQAMEAAGARLQGASAAERMVAASVLAGWAMLIYVLGRYTTGLRVRTRRAYRLVHIVAASISDNARFMLFGGMAAWTALLLEVPDPARSLLLYALATVLAARLTWGALRATLGRPRRPVQQRLARDLRRLTYAGAAATLSMLLLAQLPVSPLLSELAGRGFMLLLFILIFPLLRLRRLLLNRITRMGLPAEGGRAQAAAVGTLLVPLVVLASAAVGLVGYVNLAWAALGYLAAAVAVSVAWLTSRSILRQGVDHLKDWTVRHAGYGLLWTQGVIEPFHRLLRAALALLAWVALFYLYGWDGESPVVQGALALLDTPLVTLGSNRITLKLLLLSALVLVSMYWIARWSRELTYRWLFAGVSDSGARNSLAVFTQYSVVLIGVLVAINLLGIDLTTITVFAGALGVGLGFGLQNIANNFISGLILLAERPVRAGDTVSIGANSGNVSRIGIRSLTVRTWDNQEVIIPNADIISQPFTNWTHSDNVIRTVFIVGIGFDDDPELAQTIIREVLTDHPEVLDEPGPSVLLDGFGNSSLELRVQFYTDMSASSGPTVKSQVLMGVLAALRREGLTLPYPQQDVHIRHLPVDPERALSSGAGGDRGTLRQHGFVVGGAQ